MSHKTCRTEAEDRFPIAASAAPSNVELPVVQVKRRLHRFQHSRSTRVTHPALDVGDLQVVVTEKVAHVVPEVLVNNVGNTG